MDRDRLFTVSLLARVRGRLVDFQEKVQGHLGTETRDPECCSEYESWHPLELNKEALTQRLLAGKDISGALGQNSLHR